MRTKLAADKTPASFEFNHTGVAATNFDMGAMKSTPHKTSIDNISNEEGVLPRTECRLMFDNYGHSHEGFIKTAASSVNIIYYFL